jgi:hypothetical protein
MFDAVYAMQTNLYECKHEPGQVYHTDIPASSIYRHTYINTEYQVIPKQ